MGRKLFWTEERILEEAKKHPDKRTWNKKSPRSHKLAKQNPDLFAKCTEHMEEKLHDWTLEDCIAKAKKYGSARAWNKGCSGSYVKAINTEGWKEICEKYYSKPKPKRWTLESLRLSASKYKTPNEWKQGDYNAYMSAYRRKLIEVIFPKE